MPAQIVIDLPRSRIVIELPHLPKNHYRIVHRSRYTLDFHELQVWMWWWPFWSQVSLSGCYDHNRRVETLTALAHRHAARAPATVVVADLGPLPKE